MVGSVSGGVGTAAGSVWALAGTAAQSAEARIQASLEDGESGEVIMGWVERDYLYLVRPGDGDAHVDGHRHSYWRSFGELETLQN